MQTMLAGIARQSLQLQASGKTLFFADTLVVNGLEQRVTLGGELIDGGLALLFTFNQCKFCNDRLNS